MPNMTTSNRLFSVDYSTPEPLLARRLHAGWFSERRHSIVYNGNSGRQDSKSAFNVRLRSHRTHRVFSGGQRCQRAENRWEICIQWSYIHVFWPMRELEVWSSAARRDAMFVVISAPSLGSAGAEMTTNMASVVGDFCRRQLACYL